MSKHARDLRPHVLPSEIVAVRDIEDLVASVGARSGPIGGFTHLHGRERPSRLAAAGDA
jgi:hypothetical protein